MTSFPEQPRAVALTDGQGYLNFRTAATAAMNDAKRLHIAALFSGYNVSPSTSAELGNARLDRPGNEPTTSFRVWRIDQTPEDGQTFETFEAVRRYLALMEVLPLFCLDLADDPEPEVAVVGDEVFRVTVTDAAGSRVTFSMRVAGIEVANNFCVNAARENRPTVGSWREVHPVVGPEGMHHPREDPSG